MTLPEGTYHRFTCDETDSIHAMRLSSGPPAGRPSTASPPILRTIPQGNSMYASTARPRDSTTTRGKPSAEPTSDIVPLMYPNISLFSTNSSFHSDSAGIYALAYLYTHII